MAATLTRDGEDLKPDVFFSFPIEKQEETATINPVDGTPDILIWGKATDGTVDGDREIVDPEWSAKAIQEWADTKANVRMSHDPKRPVGKGQEVHVTTDGHYVKSLIADPLAKHFIRIGVLNDYSVGISEPDFRYRDSKLDPQGKALRVITGRPDGRSRIAEISICDRGSNFNSSFQIVKSASGFTGRMVGDEDEIAKAAPASLTKMAPDDGVVEKSQAADMSGFQMPEDLSITFTPADMAKLVQAKFVEKHYAELAAQAAKGAVEPDAAKRDFDRNVGGGTDRDKIPAEDFAGKDRSFPIVTQGDVSDALQSIGRAGDDNYDAGTLRSNIISIARRKGLSVPGDDGDSKSKGTVTETAEKADAPEAQDIEVPEAAKEAEPEVTKDPEPEAKDKPVKKAKKKKKLPPWLNKPADDEGSDDDKGSSGDTGACKSVADHLWTGIEGTSDIVCSKCKTTPAEAAGLSGTHDMTCAPVPELLESPPMASTKGGPTPASASGATGESMSPVPAHREPDGALNDPMEADMNASDGDHETPTRLEAGMMKASPEVAAILRFKRAGMDIELGRLHDLTCPAYHPEDVAKCHPFSDLSRIDVDAFQREAVKAACGPDLERSKSLTLAWQAAHVLREADPAALNDYRLAAHKAFRDANPGPNSAPTPGTVTPGKYNRPLISDGHEAASTGHDGPNSGPAVATSAPNAMHFDRPPLAAGHQSPSPSFMKASFEYPAEQGRPMHLNYAVMEKERARHALMTMHEHLSRQFPEACPMTLDTSPVVPESRGVPPTAGIGKSSGDVGATDEEALTMLKGLQTAMLVEERAAQAATKADLPVAEVLKAPAEGETVDDAVYKSFKKAKRKLGKRVLAGKMTVDEARAQLGRRFTQKGSGDEREAARKGVTYVTPGDPNLTPTQIRDLQDSLRKMAGESGGQIIVLPPGSKIGGPVGDTTPIHAVPLTPAPDALKAATAARPAPPAPVAASFSPEDIEAAVSKAVAPLLEKIQQQDDTYTTKLAEQQRVIDAIADQPDPGTAAFSGLAYNPLRNKAAGPAGVPSQAEIAERTQLMMMRTLQDKYNASSDPAEREAYYGTLAKMRGHSGQ